MAISVGLADAKGPTLLRLTLSDEERLRAITEWGDTNPRIRWMIVGDLGDRYRMVFYKHSEGSLGHTKPLPGIGVGATPKTYLTFSWAGRAVPDNIALLKEHGLDGQLIMWDEGRLIVEVRKTQLRRRKCKCRPKPAIADRVARDLDPREWKVGERVMISTLPKREKDMKTEAVYQLAKQTPGALCFTVAEGDLSLGTLYIRKEGPLAKGPAPKRLRVTVEAI